MNRIVCAIETYEVVINISFLFYDIQMTDLNF